MERLKVANDEKLLNIITIVVVVVVVSIDVYNSVIVACLIFRSHAVAVTS